MSKIEFISDRCFGCGACIQIAGKNFDYADDGRTVLINDEVTDESIEASETCPASAIIIKDSANCGCGNDCHCGDNCNCDDDCNCQKK